MSFEIVELKEEDMPMV